MRLNTTKKAKRGNKKAANIGNVRLHDDIIQWVFSWGCRSAVHDLYAQFIIHSLTGSTRDGGTGMLGRMRNGRDVWVVRNNGMDGWMGNDGKWVECDVGKGGKWVGYYVGNDGIDGKRVGEMWETMEWVGYDVGNWNGWEMGGI